MNRQSFRDYYKILQVHYLASPEVIQAAYKKLSKSYHPDTNPMDNNSMALLNEAFAVLNQANSRKEYNKLWLDHYAPENDSKLPAGQADAFPSEVSPASAEEAMERFFHALLTHSWEAAYLLLTQEDQDKTLVEDFCNWRDAIEQCSHLQAYQISYMRSFNDCRLDQTLYRHVTEFHVLVTEVDNHTLETSRETVRKCAVYDGISWRIWLGNSNIKSATLRFRMMAEKNKLYDPNALYHSAVNRIDTLTGLLSETGFYTEAQKEVARTKRYQNPFTLLAFQLHCNSKEKETACLIQLADVIKDSMRSTDIAARLDNNQIICLLTETRKLSGDLAARKFLRLISEKQSEDYQVSFGVVFYTGFNDIKDAILTACSIADQSI